MAEDDQLKGLNCPNCGGIVPVPEGQVIVRCPYCDLRSFVRGERGILRYQVPQRIDHTAASERLNKFLSSSLAIAPAARKTPRSPKPSWSTCLSGQSGVWWAAGFLARRALAAVMTGATSREVRLVQEMSWNGAACDVGEFGVAQVPHVELDLHPFDPEDLHNRAMVFEPAGLFSEARRAAEEKFEEQVRQKSGLDRLGQVFVRYIRRRFALVYHPLWVLRYQFRSRAFQVVVDGYSGQVLYGKAPGNTLYRALVLVAGMALGAFLAVDGSAFLLSISDSDDSGWGFLAPLIFGGVLMFASFRKYRHGEQYEYRQAGRGSSVDLGELTELVGSVKEVEKWIKQFN